MDDASNVGNWELWGRLRQRYEARAAVIQWGSADPAKSFVFVDGGTTAYNCPAFAMVRMATHPAYRLNWHRGTDAARRWPSRSGGGGEAGFGRPHG